MTRELSMRACAPDGRQDGYAATISGRAYTRPWRSRGAIRSMRGRGLLNTVVLMQLEPDMTEKSPVSSCPGIPRLRHRMHLKAS